jgi:hypothetical protein
MAEEETVLEVPTVIPRVFYMALLAIGVAFYFIWSALFNAWTDLAVYTISALLIGFGLVGTLLYTILGKQATEE